MDRPFAHSLPRIMCINWWGKSLPTNSVLRWPIRLDQEKILVIDS